MDEFGVLVESIGFKANGRSAPMAKMKPKAKSNLPVRSSDDSYSFSVDELDGIFRSNLNVNKSRLSQSFFGEDDAFGAPISSSNQYAGIDLESMLSSSNNRKNGSNLNSRDSGGSNAYHDLLGSKSTHRYHVDDLFGSSSTSSAGKPEKKGPDPVLDDFMPGFGVAGPANIRASPSHPTIIDDPFSVFESSASQSDASWRFAGSSDNYAGNAPVQSSFDDDFTDFVSGDSANVSKADGIRRTGNNPSSETTSNGFQNTDYLDEIFGGGNSAKSNKSSSMSQNPPFDDLFHEEKRPEVRQTSSKSSFRTKKAFSVTNGGIDVSSLFGDISTSSEEFHEIEGEPEERRRARLNRHMRTNARMAEALAEKNQRDLQSQREQEEKCRLAETVDYDIKRWAAGKEDNLRALLSSLQEVLWPECGWCSASLTDMITSGSVKNVYKRAIVYVHPDKVQHKGASLQQRYIAEKVFYILKEAYNKFSAEELR